MKVLIVLLLAVACASAFDLRNTEFIDISQLVPENRIINGQTAKAGQFPYQVGLSIQVTSTSSAWCGGSLISPTWVLTAAHCTDGVKSVKVFLGSTTRASGTSVTATQIINHSGWNTVSKANDIALLRIPAVTLGTNIKVIALPSASASSYVNDVAVASGWGKTSDSGSTSNTLMYASLTIVAKQTCVNTYGSAYVRDSNICSLSPSGTSTCNGDSGGPLAYDNLLIGLTSFGAAAGCTKGYPVAFTRVSSYRSWIKTNAGI